MNAPARSMPLLSWKSQPLPLRFQIPWCSPLRGPEVGGEHLGAGEKSPAETRLPVDPQEKWAPTETPHQCHGCQLSGTQMQIINSEQRE